MVKVETLTDDEDDSIDQIYSKMHLSNDENQSMEPCSTTQCDTTKEDVDLCTLQLFFIYS